MAEFSLQIDSKPFEALDELALLARQDYNLGNTGRWFREFRGGLHGFYARHYGARLHYREVHAWLPRIRIPTETEYHLASILFQMDSAFECLTFALNALGWAVLPSDFHDVTDAKTLKRISPLDITGEPSWDPPLAPMPGYANIFPGLQALWKSRAGVITKIRDLHDVSKHRRTIFVGGQARLDPPDGFYEALGIPEESSRRASLWPMAEIILKHDPKAPATDRTPKAVEPGELLEDLAPSFAALVNASGTAVLEDAQANVPLKEAQFRPE